MVISSSPTRLQEALCSRCTDRGGGRRCRSAPGPRLGGPQVARTPASETGARGRAPSPPDAVLLPGSRGRRWGRGHGQRRWVPQEVGRAAPPAPPSPASRCSRHPLDIEDPNKEAQLGDKGRTPGTNAHGRCRRERPGSQARPTKGPGAGPGMGLSCTCRRCPGDGPLPERSAGPLSGAHRTCHTPDGRVLCKSVIGGRVKECGRAAGWGAICSLRPRAPAGIELPAGRPSLHCGFN